MEQVISDRPPRIRRNNEQICYLLSEFEKAGVSVKEFCTMHNISKATFHKWQSRYKPKQADSTNLNGFADLHIIPSAGQTSLFAEVNGIRIYQPVAAAYLKELLS